MPSAIVLVVPFSGIETLESGHLRHDRARESLRRRQLLDIAVGVLSIDVLAISIDVDQAIANLLDVLCAQGRAHPEVRVALLESVAADIQRYQAIRNRDLRLGWPRRAFEQAIQPFL